MARPPYPIIIGLGCNLGPRRETLEQAVGLLERSGVRLLRHSRLYWTRPWGVIDQPSFLNGAICVWTRLSPLALLERCQGIERRLGRRPGPRWGARRIDLDLLLYGTFRLCHPRLTLPHPGIAQRDFVLAPLRDLGAAPVASVAPLGWARALAALPAADRTVYHSEPWKGGIR